jgi:hypothetical protein
MRQARQENAINRFENAGCNRWVWQVLGVMCVLRPSKKGLQKLQTL